MDKSALNYSKDQKASIMLIDNSQVDNFVNLKLFEQTEFRAVKCFSNAAIALESLLSNNQKYHLILIEVDLPVIDGFEFINRFYELELHKKHGKIILLSSLFNPLQLKKANDKKIKLIEKPFSIGKLINSLLL